MTSPRNHVPENEMQRTADLYRQHGTTTLVARELGLSPMAVCRRLNIMGVKRDGRRGRPAMTPDTLGRTAALYGRLGSVGSVAAVLHITKSAVKKRLKRAGVSVADERRRRAEPAGTEDDAATRADAERLFREDA